MDRDCLRIEFIDPGMGSVVLGVVQGFWNGIYVVLETDRCRSGIVSIVPATEWSFSSEA
jgi:hypothetical protein